MSIRTPGQWIARGTFIGTDETDTQTVAYVDDHRNRRSRSREQSEANARFIAAAPDLFEALQIVDRWLKSQKFDTQTAVRAEALRGIIHAAFDKAEGMASAAGVGSILGFILGAL